MRVDSDSSSAGVSLGARLEGVAFFLPTILNYKSGRYLAVDCVDSSGQMGISPKPAHTFLSKRAK